MIKNYTSGVPPERSVNHIEKSLISHGARNIMKTYGPDGKLDGLLFVIPQNGKDIPYMLRSHIDKVEKKLRESVRRPHKGTGEKIRIQAERTAWKIISDEIDIKMTRIDLNQIEMLEGFLPYAYDARKMQTFFEKIKEGGMKMITTGE